MRWFWIDRFLEFERGRRAVAIKSVTLAEEAIDEYVPGHPLLPASLIVEGLAQAGGLLVGEMGGFEDRVVLAKVGIAKFHHPAFPGDTLTYRVTIENQQAHGAVVTGESRIGDSLQAEVEMVFAHLDGRFAGVELFDPSNFLRMLRLLRLYDVGRNEHGNPLEIPPRLLAAEKAANSRD